MKKEIRKFNKDNVLQAAKPFSEFVSKIVHLIPQYTHHYEIFPYTYNSVITMNGEVIDRQSYYSEGEKYKVIYKGNTTIVILEDGTKGIAKRKPMDRYDKNIGKSIAYTRAKIKQLEKQLEELIK